MNYYQVAVNFPSAQSVLTYRSKQLFNPGDLVKIPLGRRNERGCVVEQTVEGEEEFEIKDILTAIESFKIDRHLLDLLTWIAHYYHYSLGKLVFDVLPRPLSKLKKLHFHLGQGRKLGFTLNPLQKEITQKIVAKLSVGYSSHLIHGVTGSGKTAIYLELIKAVMKRGQSVLFLLPEINLTAQFLALFERHIDGLIYTYNSSLRNSDKFGLWKLLETDRTPRLILGARSAIFLPESNLGLIIMDEEHDSSFKQDDRCPYHTRNVAMKRGSLLGIPIVLGSATPATDTLKNFVTNPTHYYSMTQRVSHATFPSIELVDIRGRKETVFSANSWPISTLALEAIAEALGKGEQVLIFINRLGYAHYLQCRACGHQFFCQNCSVPLKYFKSRDILKCQHCDYQQSAPMICPDCDNLNLLQMGFGTEKVQEVVQELFPNQVVARFDREELTTIKQVELCLHQFHQGKIDILVGTQMLSKGHNFERVNLVLILGADAQLSYPDFRAQERVFQQLSQVAGRAGRFSQKGRVMIQTFMPEAKIYAQVKKNSVQEFYRSELALRKEFNYPPYVKMAIVYLSCKSNKVVTEESLRLGELLKILGKKHFAQVDIYGPQTCNIERRAGQFSRMLLLKSGSINQLHNLLSSLGLNFKLRRGVSLKIDIDPINIM